MVLARPKTEFDQCSRVGYGLALPAIVSLIAAHGRFAGLVPCAGSFSAQVMLADQRFLNRLRSLGIDFLLAADTLSARAFSSRDCMRPGRRVRPVGRIRCALVILGGDGFCGNRLSRISIAGRTCAPIRCRESASPQHANCRESDSQDFSPNSQRETFDFKMKSPTKRWHRNHPRLDVAMPVFVGLVSVTEVYRPGRWFHPAAMNLANAPGRLRPARSSGSIRSGRTLPRC